MSNLENAKILDDLWERFQEVGGDVEELCNRVNISAPDMTQTKLIDILEEEIRNL